MQHSTRGSANSCTAKIILELDLEPYRLNEAKEHDKARMLLNRLIQKDVTLGVEPLLTFLASIQAAEEIVGQVVEINKTAIEARDARLLDQLLKKWLFHRCNTVSEVKEQALHSHQELLRRVCTQYYPAARESVHDQLRSLARACTRLVGCSLLRRIPRHYKPDTSDGIVSL